jgi:magnesium chelatase family protein
MTTTAHTCAVLLSGIDAEMVELRADLTGDHPQTGLLGRLAAAETLDRIRAAVRNSDLPWPAAPVALSLSTPAPLAAAAGADLAGACVVLAASGVVPAERVAQTLLVGELTLDGRVRPVRGVLPAMLAARRAGLRCAVVPGAQMAEGSLVPDMEVVRADRLTDVVGWLRDAPPRQPPRPDRVATDPENAVVDLISLRRQPDAALALEVAAAGGHSLWFLGPVGSGQTLLARCLPGLLPDLSGEQALEVMAIRSLAGTVPAQTPLSIRPPFVAPHYSASLAALVGGGPATPRPGAVSLAHHGVLFLDDAPQFAPRHRDAVHAALDAGEVRLARRDRVTSYPARFQLVLASPLCPCGAAEPACTCTPSAQRRYLSRLSGPLLDRIDLRVRLRPDTPLAAEAAVSDSTAVVRQRVMQARQRAAHRWADHGTHTNADVPATVLRREPPVPGAVFALLEDGLAAGSLTRRGADRALRVAWTLADLAGLDTPSVEQMAMALAFRDRRPSSQR